MDQRAHTVARHRAPAALVFVVAGALTLAACGSSSPSVGSRVRQSGSTTTSSTATTTTTTTPATTTTTAPTTTTTAVPANLQRITFNGLAVEVPKNWPVYNLATDPNRCVRLDVNAVYLGQEGSTPQCPARVLGHTDTLQIEALNARGQQDGAVATQSGTLNGLTVREDPHAATSGAFTVVFPDLQLVAIVTFGNSPTVAEQILASLQHA